MAPQRSPGEFLIPIPSSAGGRVGAAQSRELDETDAEQPNNVGAAEFTDSADRALTLASTADPTLEFPQGQSNQPVEPG